LKFKHVSGLGVKYFNSKQTCQVY